jgi:methionine sulfoxide reductase heme-binding subunit
MTNSALWYTARATGVVSLVLLTLVVALGIASRSGRPLVGLPRFAVAAVHRNASLLAVTMLVIHVTTLLLDVKAKVHLSDVLVPFIGAYRPFWQGLGTFALELLVALIVTSLVRHRIPERLWRSIHWFAYACWPIAFAHGLGTGTDSGTGWMRAIAGGCAAAVAAAIAWRLAHNFEEHSDVRRPLTRRPPAALGRTR